MKKLIKVIASIIVMIGIVGVVAFFYIKSRPTPEIQVNSVVFNEMKDGSYIGEYESFPVKAKVKVEVLKNKIVSIEILEHDHGLGKKAENITKDIIEKQSVEVDVVSGATHSSKVILKAVERALENGKK